MAPSPFLSPRAYRAAIGALLGKPAPTVHGSVDLTRKRTAATFGSTSVFEVAEETGALVLLLAGSDRIEDAPGAYERLAGLQDQADGPTLAGLVQTCLASAALHRLGVMPSAIFLRELTVSRSHRSAAATLEMADGAMMRRVFGNEHEAPFEVSVTLRRDVLDAISDLVQVHDVCCIAAARRPRALETRS